jgi:TRAP-type C4-dicarboxylate transport system permease small subunit
MNALRRNAMPSLKLTIIETIAALMTAAFGLIAALAWNGAISALIAQYFSKGDALTGDFVYAIIVTVIAVIAILLIARSLSKLKAKEVAAEPAKSK